MSTTRPHIQVGFRVGELEVAAPTAMKFCWMPAPCGVAAGGKYYQNLKLVFGGYPMPILEATKRCLLFTNTDGLPWSVRTSAQGNGAHKSHSKE